MQWTSKYGIGDLVILVETKEEAVVAGITLNIYEDMEIMETYNVRVGSGRKRFGFSVQQLEPIQSVAAYS